jgi:hypothetical protein
LSVTIDNQWKIRQRILRKVEENFSSHVCHPPPFSSRRNH